jgi:hypothetical protein
MACHNIQCKCSFLEKRSKPSSNPYIVRLSPVEAAFAQHTSYPAAMAGTVGVVLILAAAMTLLGNERRATVFGAGHEASS